MSVIVMFVWMFIIRAIPFKKIFSGLACLIVFAVIAVAINNYNANLLPQSNIILINDKY